LHSTKLKKTTQTVAGFEALQQLFPASLVLEAVSEVNVFVTQWRGSFFFDREKQSLVRHFSDNSNKTKKKPTIRELFEAEDNRR